MKIYQIISKDGTEYLRGRKDECINDYLTQHEDLKQEDLDVERIFVNGYLDAFGQIETGNNDLILTQEHIDYLETSFGKALEKLIQNKYGVKYDEEFIYATYESINYNTQVLIIEEQFDNEDEIFELLKS